jgi:hypothetical protein
MQAQVVILSDALKALKRSGTEVKGYGREEGDSKSPGRIFIEVSANQAEVEDISAFKATSYVVD